MGVIIHYLYFYIFSIELGLVCDTESILGLGIFNIYVAQGKKIKARL